MAFSPGKRLNATSEDISQTGNLKGDTTIINNQAFDISSSFGFGLSYVNRNKLTLAADLLYEPWGESRFFDNSSTFTNRFRVALGGEYIYKYEEKGFFNKVRYRAGIHYGNSYIQVKNQGYTETGASIGLGIPLPYNRSVINLALEYVKIKPETRLLIDEQYFRITINYTFNEAWFYKFKVE